MNRRTSATLPSIPPLSESHRFRAIGVAARIRDRGLSEVASELGCELETLTDWAKRYTAYMAALRDYETIAVSCRRCGESLTPANYFSEAR